MRNLVLLTRSVMTVCLAFAYATFAKAAQPPACDDARVIAGLWEGYQQVAKALSLPVLLELKTREAGTSEVVSELDTPRNRRMLGGLAQSGGNR